MRIATRWNVAAVANHHPGRCRADEVPVRYTVRSINTSVTPAKANNPISEFVEGPHKNPAAGFGNHDHPIHEAVNW